MDDNLQSCQSSQNQNKPLQMNNSASPSSISWARSASGRFLTKFLSKKHLANLSEGHRLCILRFPEVFDPLKFTNTDGDAVVPIVKPIKIVDIDIKNWIITYIDSNGVRKNKEYTYDLFRAKITDATIQHANRIKAQEEIKYEKYLMEKLEEYPIPTKEEVVIDLSNLVDAVYDSASEDDCDRRDRNRRTCRSTFDLQYRKHVRKHIHHLTLGFIDDRTFEYGLRMNRVIKGILNPANNREYNN